MSRRGATLVLGTVLLLVFGGTAARLPVPYVVLGPGPTVNTLGTFDGKPVITVTGRPTSTSKGRLALTTVSVTDRIDLLTAMRAWFDRRYAVIPREAVYPPDQTEKQVDEQNAEEFRVSQDAAEVAALRELGHPLQVVVTEVRPDAAARGVLRAGDVITAIDGNTVTGYESLVGQIGGKQPGSKVTVTIRRNGEERQVEVTLQARAEQPAP